MANLRITNEFFAAKMLLIRGVYCEFDKKKKLFLVSIAKKKSHIIQFLVIIWLFFK